MTEGLLTSGCQRLTEVGECRARGMAVQAGSCVLAAESTPGWEWEWGIPKVGPVSDL